MTTGVKHSITKRSTRRARWEVRLHSLGRRSAVRALLRGIFPQVAAGLVTAGPNRGVMNRSWPKRIGLRALGLVGAHRPRRCKGIEGRARGGPERDPGSAPRWAYSPSAPAGRTGRPPVVGGAPRRTPSGRSAEHPPARVGGPASVRPVARRCAGGRAPTSSWNLGWVPRCEAPRAWARVLHGRTLESAGRVAPNWPKRPVPRTPPGIMKTAAPSLSVTGAHRAALAENPHHGRL